MFSPWGVLLMQDDDRATTSKPGSSPAHAGKVWQIT